MKKPKARQKPSKSRLKSRRRLKILANIISKPIREAVFTKENLLKHNWEVFAPLILGTKVPIPDIDPGDFF